MQRRPIQGASLIENPNFKRTSAAIAGAAALVAIPALAPAAPFVQELSIAINSNPSQANTPTSASYTVDVDNDAVSDFSFNHSTTPTLDINSKTDLNGKLTLTKGLTT